jgi:DNA polymerase (family 10)
MADRFEVAQVLAAIGRRLRLTGENPFRARAYERGARALERLTEDFDTLVAEHRLTEVSGIGAALAGTIEEIARTGQSATLDKLRVSTPDAVVELTEVVTPAQAAAIHATLGIATVDELRTALDKGDLSRVKGFGPATEAKVREALRRRDASEGRMLLVDADARAVELLEHLGRVSDRVEMAGAVRRRAESVDGLRVVVSADDPAKVVAAFRKWGTIHGVKTTEPGRAVGRLAEGLPVELYAVPPAEFERALFLATGSDAHVAAVVERLGGTLPDVRNEAAIYRAAGLRPLPPELREEAEDVEAAARGELPGDLVALKDIRGAIHCHTVYSDGRDTVEDMARAAEALGLSYLTITDHSPTAHYAGGVDVDRLKRQWEEIDVAQEKVSIQLLRGTESDILLSGLLDYPDAVLEQFDVIVASIHTRGKLDRAAMTERVTRAMELPVFKIWGHPLGRLVLRRDPIDVDVEHILDVIARSPAAIEINGDPYRLDLEPRLVRLAREREIPLVISTDAHSTGGIGNLVYGVSMARRAGVQRGEVLNTLPVQGFRDAVRPVGAAAARRRAG